MHKNAVQRSGERRNRVSFHFNNISLKEEKIPPPSNNNHFRVNDKLNAVTSEDVACQPVFVGAACGCMKSSAAEGSLKFTDCQRLCWVCFRRNSREMVGTEECRTPVVAFPCAE